MKRYLAIVSRPADIDPALIDAHKHWLQELLQAGTLLMSGPFAEGGGGAYLFRAADREAAQAVVTGDPILGDPRARIPLKEWVIRLQATEDKA